MRHKVPIHLEQSDHLLAGLTARQILIIACGCSIGYMLFDDLMTSTPATWGLLLGVALGLLIASCSILAAFIQIKGRGLEQWALITLLYYATPKVYLWKLSLEEDELPVETTQKESGKYQEKQKEEEAW